VERLPPKETWCAPRTTLILARIEHAEGEHEHAVAHLAAAEVLRRLHTPLWPLAQERQERLLAELREIVGEAAFVAAYTRGTKLEIEDVQEIAPNLASSLEQQPSAPHSSGQSLAAVHTDERESLTLSTE
jgi:hypothetical protein